MNNDIGRAILRLTEHTLPNGTFRPGIQPLMVAHVVVCTVAFSMFLRIHHKRGSIAVMPVIAMGKWFISSDIRYDLYIRNKEKIAELYKISKSKIVQLRKLAMLDKMR